MQSGSKTEVGESPHQPGDELAHGGVAVADHAHGDDLVARVTDARDHRVEIASVLRGDVPLHDLFALLAEASVVRVCHGLLLA
jgi:hypothetical protein